MSSDRYRVVCPTNDWSNNMHTLEQARRFIERLDAANEKGACTHPHHIERDTWNDGTWKTEVVQ